MQNQRVNPTKQKGDDMTHTIDRPQTTTTSAWMKLARAGSITMVIWAILVHATARVLIPPILVVGLIFLGFVPFLRGERRRLGLALAVVAALAIAGNLPPIIDELSNPDSAPAFILTLLSTLAAAVTITAGLGSFFGWPVAPIRALGWGAVAAFVIGTAGSLVISANTATAEALASDVKVTAEFVQFVPGEITVDGTTEGVWVENRDGIRHTFTIEELGVDLEVPAFKAGRVDIEAAPGTYQVICTVPGHEEMTGTLVVGG